MADAITPGPVWDAQQLQRALHRAVLAVAAMQRDEAAVVAVGFQLGQVGMRRIEGMASTPRARSACSTPPPDISETSRSAECRP